MSQGIPSKEQHPIREKSLEPAHQEHDGGELGTDIKHYHDTLAHIQHHIELNKLRGLLEASRADRETIQCIHESDNGWAFVDYRADFWDEVFSEIGLTDPRAPDVVRDAHKAEGRLISDVSDPLTLDAELNEKIEPLVDREDPDVIVVAKGEVWRNAETAFTDQMIELVKHGCTPAQVLDYWMVEKEGLTQTTWAKVRQVDQSTVSENVTLAREALESTGGRTYGHKELQEIDDRLYRERESDHGD